MSGSFRSRKRRIGAISPNYARRVGLLRRRVYGGFRRTAHGSMRRRTTGGRSFGWKGRSSMGGSQIARWTGHGCLPWKFRTQVMYHSIWLDTTAVPGFVDHVYRGNSPYDPYYSAGGTMATGWTQLYGAWQMYKVIGSRISVKCVNQDLDDPLRVIVIPTDFGNPYLAANSHNLAGTTLAHSGVVLNQVGQGRVAHSARTSTMRNTKDIDDIGFQAAMQANPAHEWFWHVCLYNLAGHQLNTEVEVDITYDVVLSSPTVQTS